jgi:hypothetical protein
MGRLLGVVSRGPIYYDLFEEFADLADRGNTPHGHPDERGHRAGWGIAFFRGGALERHVHGEGSAPNDPTYYKEAWRIGRINAERDPEAPPMILLAHLRRAGPAAPKDAGSAHPLAAEVDATTYAFQHHGSLEGRRADGRAVAGAYFEAVRTRLATGDVPAAFRGARKDLLAAYGGYTSLTAMLASGSGLHCYRDYARDGSYYTLFVDDFGEMVVVCSEPILGMKENPIPRGWLVSVDTDLAVERRRVL